MASEKDYIHGGNYKADFKRLGVPQKEIVDFSVNVNPLGPPPIVKKIWNSLFDEVKKYPSQNGIGVKKYYEDMFGIDSSNVLPGNGSTELIYFVLQKLSLKNIVIISPSFNDYSQAATISGTTIIDVHASSDNGFAMPPIDLINKKLNYADAVFIGHPNNPTGAMFSKDEILFLSKENPTKWILLDEAFIQFVDNYEEQSFLKSNIISNIILFHSLTKYYTVPGLRLGAVIANNKIISKLETEKSLWSINRPAEILVEYLRDSKSFVEKTEQYFSAERKKLFIEYSNLAGIKIFPTNSNFFLARWNATNNLDDLQRELLTNGLYVRDARNFKHLSDNYFRFAILSKNENQKLFITIKKSIEKYL